MFTNRKKAPLGGLKFYKYVIIPFKILGYYVYITEAVAVCTTDTIFNVLILGVVLTMLCIISELGLIRWKKYGLICVYILIWSNIPIILFVYPHLEFRHDPFRLVVSMAISTLWTIYFARRSPLFGSNYEEVQNSQ